MNEEEFFKKRLAELAQKAYSRSICTFTNFLNLNEIDLLYTISNYINYVNMGLYGGAQYCERKIARFGDLDIPYPIQYIHITPVLKKFSDKLSHRDFLGALINLGIKREVLGDIIVADNEAYIFCLDNISEFIIENLTRVKHTVVKCALTENIPSSITDTSVPENLQVASLRIDAVISEVFKLSRNKSQELIKSRKVFVNGRLTENNSLQLKDSDSVTVRSTGKFIFNSINYATKKCKLNIKVSIFR